MAGELAPDRVVVRLTGADRQKFLHGLVTMDVKPEGGGLSYSALLTPQGKFLADFFLIDGGDHILLDVAELFAQGLVQRLSMYKLRADVTIEITDLHVTRGLGEPPVGAWPDPRHEALGWRAYGLPGTDPAIDWDAMGEQ